MSRSRDWKAGLYQRETTLNHPEISELAFHRHGNGPWLPYGELDDMGALEREMVRQELRDLGREDDELE